MKRNTSLRVYLALILVFALQVIIAQKFNWQNDFSDSTSVLKIIGRGDCYIKNGVFTSKESYASFGKVEWKNYVIKFKARATQSADQVQIWAGFRAFNRSDRYVLGLRGGLQNSLYLSRMGYMGTDQFIGLRPLHFEPKPGTWYDIKIEVCGNRIRVFLNNESIPRMDVVDKNANLAPTGEITLGGSWIETEFDDLSITSLDDSYLKNATVKELEFKMEPSEKVSKRIAERTSYKPIIVNNTNNSRSEISLDGQWLFMPEQELVDAKKAADLSINDNNWHVMSVPNFWNPSRIWLHGESFEGHQKGVSDVYFQQETDRCANYSFDYTKTKVAWYRQWIELPADIQSKHVTLNFDAVSKVAEVFINGQLAGSHIGMFGDFEVDGSPLFRAGKNLVAVRVVRDFINKIEDGDKIIDVAVSVPVTNSMIKDIAHGFFKDEPAGIWQPVKMVITEKAKIEDVYIKPSLTGATFDVTIKNHATNGATYNLQTEILDKETGSTLYVGNSLTKIELKAGEQKLLTYKVTNLKPQLWTPNHPNLYNFNVKLVSAEKEADSKTITSGFRTFESKNGFFYLNGKQYWLRGGNHTPFALAPNDINLANSFYQLMKAGNMDVTRTHTSPYNELWTTAADENGIGISYEGTWPWLMIKSTFPDSAIIKLWADEFLTMLKKYRNHPSILFWTVNNEMKFYDNDPDIEQAKRKMKIISDVVKRMRAIDPTRPISFDSNYKRKKNKFGADFFTTIDDGDIDDDHKYINWYDNSIFRQFNGEFQRDGKTPGRPLISQEASSGYPNGETGHATRFYNLVHQTPQSLIGNQSYEFADPQAFLNVQSFITGEVAEAYRRTNDKASGILHFALLTWFRSVYDVKNVEPYPTYYAMKRAMQPVLVSAELWGRNFYGGEKLATKICIVNDKENGTDLKESKLIWELQTNSGEKIIGGNAPIPVVKHSTRYWMTPEILIPDILPSNKLVAKFKIKLIENGISVSENEYQLNLATKAWSRSSINAAKKIALVDFNGINKSLDFLKVNYASFSSIASVLQSNADVYIFSGLDTTKNCSNQDIQQLRNKLNNGAKVLILNSPEASMKLYPEYITGLLSPPEAEIVSMEMPESPVFDGIGLFDLRYFNNNKTEQPKVCNNSFQANRHKNVLQLANHYKVHGYIEGDMEKRSDFVKSINGFTILRINQGGSAILSSMKMEKSVTDPIAGRLFVNMINDLINK